MSSTACSARIGPPAAIRPSIGTYAGVGRCERDASSSIMSLGARTSTARGRFGSRRRKPFFSSSLSW